ncbi:hypothetical protein HYC85_011560 [Camellia sinensis]|uniref:Uncharacterized protein n=1 Tax=Camellia sinensis TaxID=4442 RepID=A0A7J7HAL1_CAMSI|nr:hypothetical protein HYC85_011560 [Camellia sinensis]
MAGIGIVLELLRKNPSLSGQTLHSYGFFSASLAASTAAASVAAATPFASRVFFRNTGRSIVYCDAGAALTDEDYITSIRNASANIFLHDSLHYSTKEYKIELKPLFSAFGLRFLALASLRSFLSSYLSLSKSRSNVEEDDDDFLQDDPGEHQVDLVVPFKKSVKQVIHETTVVTTRRVLERISVHYVSQRMAWKLLKDIPKSAVRKAERGMPTFVYFVSVSKTTFRGHLLGVAASWLVQVGIDIYRFFSYMSREDDDQIDRAEQVQLLGKKVYGTTVRCGASLVFASIGAGIGASLFRPLIGQWIGCVVGDTAGPLIVSFCFEKVFGANF